MPGFNDGIVDDYFTRKRKRRSALMVLKIATEKYELVESSRFSDRRDLNELQTGFTFIDKNDFDTRKPPT